MCVCLWFAYSNCCGRERVEAFFPSPHSLKTDNRTNTVLFLREDVKLKRWKRQKKGWYTAFLKDCFVEKNWPYDLRKAFNRAVFGLQWRWKINENLFQVYFSLVIWQMRAKPGKSTSFNLQTWWLYLQFCRLWFSLCKIRAFSEHFQMFSLKLLFFFTWSSQERHRSKKTKDASAHGTKLIQTLSWLCCNRCVYHPLPFPILLSSLTLETQPS